MFSVFKLLPDPATSPIYSNQYFLSFLIKKQKTLKIIIIRMLSKMKTSKSEYDKTNK